MRLRTPHLNLSTPLLVLALFVMAVDVAIFNYLYPALGLASSHIASFMVASTFAYFVALFSSNSLSNNHGKIKFSTFIFALLLIVCLRGGLLGTLTQIMGVPALPASIITAVFSTAALYAGYIFTEALEGSPAFAKADALCIAAVAYIVLLKLLYLGLPELIFEEAYYWNYAQHLDIGYLDHPLIVAWTIHFFTSLLGNIEFGVRLGAFLYGFITAYYAYKLSEAVFNKSVAYRALLLLAALPAYFSFGFFMTPDAPLTACWAAAIYYSYRVFVEDDHYAWLKLGVALGLGMSSKYTIALLGAAIVILMVFDKNARKWLWRREPYLAAIIALLLFSPVIIWNIQHDWLSFTFQSQGRVNNGQHFSLPRLISNLLITLTPIGLMSIFAVVLSRKSLLTYALKVSKQANLQLSYWVLIWLALFPIGVYTTLSLFRESKLNWTGPCWLGLMPFFALLVSTSTVEHASKLLKISIRAWPATFGVLLIVYGVGLHFLGVGLPYVNFPQNTHLIGFERLSAEIENIKTTIEKESGEKILVVGMDRNKIASGLAFYRAKYAEKSAHPALTPAFDTASQHLFGGNGLMYELWFPVNAQNNKTMLLVDENIEDLSANEVLSRTVNQSEIKPITAYKNGLPAGQYYYRLVHGYHAK